MGRILNSDLGPNVVNQDIYEISDVRRHPLGTRLVVGNRVFHYAKATAAITNSKLLVRSSYHQHIMYAAIQAAAAAGDTEIKVTVANTDGAANDGLFAIDDMQGGYVAIFDASTSEWLNFHIKGNNAVASGGGTITLYLDGELPIALTTSDVVEAMASPYYVTDVNTQDRYAFMGLPMRLATAASPYFWIQTWGPCWVNPQPLVGVSGPSQPVCEVVARHDGTIDVPIYNDANVRQAQRVGHVLTVAQDGTQAAPFINLQISP